LCGLTKAFVDKFQNSIAEAKSLNSSETVAQPDSMIAPGVQNTTGPPGASRTTDQTDMVLLLCTKSSAINIDLNLPVVVVPLNSHSNSVIVVDFGILQASSSMSIKVDGVINRTPIDTLSIKWSMITVVR
jgi:hypothetical protein